MNIPAIALDPFTVAAHLPVFNANVNALARGALHAIVARRSHGLDLTLYGGNIPSNVGPVVVPMQSLVLTPSATNYVYADSAGEAFTVTTPPAGWPGPLSSGSRALYELDVGADSVTDGTCYLLGTRGRGPQGPDGAAGTAGASLHKQRLRMLGFNGNGTSSYAIEVGLSIASGGLSTRTVGWTGGHAGLVPVVASGAMAGNQRLVAVGSPGGFDVIYRWTYDTSFQHAGQRLFVGLYDTSAGAISNTQPSTLLNMVGFGCDDTDDVFVLMHNDGSGAATRTALSPVITARPVDAIFEVRLQCAPGASEVAWSLWSDLASGIASGVITTNLPATYLAPVLHSAVGTGAGGVLQNMCHIVINSRY